MPSWSQSCLLAVVTLGMVVSTARAADERKNTPAEGPEAEASVSAGQAAIEKKFAEDLSGVVFAGSYSVTAAGKETPAEMEKYTINRVSKVKDREDYWLFVTRIQYGKTDLEVPLMLQVKWAGDTPVITLTNLTIPGLGTFTSRVMIYGERYAGTWQHGKTGGHLWGRIEKVDKSAEPNGKTPAATPPGAK
ncbi:MAG: hypothetical protein ACM3U2_21245 [Deltaproteobacteria bacterium]